MKYVLIVILAAALLLTSCSKETKAPAAVVDITQPDIEMPKDPVTPVPVGVGVGPAETPASEYGVNAGVTVVRTVSYTFEQDGKFTLYGAAEYTNSGDCPVIITSAAFTFTAGGSLITNEFVPVLNQYDVVLPGQSSYVTLWLPYEGETSLPPDVTVTASLKCERTETPRIGLELDHLYLADNYPGFTTLSGTIRSLSDTECSLNLAYAAFYDDAGALLGVFYFTKNATLTTGDEKNFVVHMTGLPIEGLAAKTAEVRSAAFGFN
jgi:hypothetical protein